MAVTSARPGVTVFRDELIRLPKKGYRILVPISNPSTSGELLDLATALARGQRGEVVALHVLVSDNRFPDEEEQRSAAARRTILEQVVANRRRTPVPIHTVTRIAGSPAEGILATAREDGYNLILLGWEGRLRPVSLGSSLGEVLDPVVKDAPCNVAVAKIRSLRSVRRILIPTAGGPNAAIALELGQALSRRYRAEITLLYVARKGREEHGRRALARTAQVVKPTQIIHEQVVVADRVVKGILKEAKDYDLVILGASQEGVFQQILFGVVPEQVAKRCSKTVIMVKGAHGRIVTGVRRLWSVVLSRFSGTSKGAGKLP